MITFDAVRMLCAHREVDLVLAPPPAPFVLCIHGQFDGNGDFFSIVAKDVEYVELAGGFTVGDLVMTTEVNALSRLAPKWGRLAGLYSGSAIAFRSADSDGWGDDRDTFVVVANFIEWREGSDWRDIGGQASTGDPAPVKKE